jgi:hypothetical protein
MCEISGVLGFWGAIGNWTKYIYKITIAVDTEN